MVVVVVCGAGTKTVAKAVAAEDCFIHDDCYDGGDDGGDDGDGDGDAGGDDCYDGGGHDVGDDHGWRGVW